MNNSRGVLTRGERRQFNNFFVDGMHLTECTRLVMDFSLRVLNYLVGNQITVGPTALINNIEKYN